MIKLSTNIDWLRSKTRDDSDDVVSVGGLISYLRPDPETPPKKLPRGRKPPLSNPVNVPRNTASYVRIENHIVSAIASGHFKPGDKLPSAQELSGRFGVNPITVTRAYRDLEVMGYLRARRGMGVFVNHGVESKCRVTCRKQITDRLHEVIVDAKGAGMSSQEIKDLCAKLAATAPRVP